MQALINDLELVQFPIRPLYCVQWKNLWCELERLRLEDQNRCIRLLHSRKGLNFRKSQGCLERDLTLF